MACRHGGGSGPRAHYRTARYDDVAPWRRFRWLPAGNRVRPGWESLTPSAPPIGERCPRYVDGSRASAPIPAGSRRRGRPGRGRCPRRCSGPSSDGHRQRRGGGRCCGGLVVVTSWLVRSSSARPIDDRPYLSGRRHRGRSRRGGGRTSWSLWWAMVTVVLQVVVFVLSRARRMVVSWRSPAQLLPAPWTWAPSMLTSVQAPGFSSVADVGHQPGASARLSAVVVRPERRFRDLQDLLRGVSSRRAWPPPQPGGCVIEA